MTELTTFGESMLRLTPPDGLRLEQTSELDLYVAGAESNVAVAASRLGVDSSWISKLPNSALGRRTVNGLSMHGIRTDVVWSDSGKQGIYFVEPGAVPRGTNVIYDRDGAAIRTAVPEELPLDRIRDSELFYTSGITPALSDTLRETTDRLLSEANDAGVTTAFDVNYRSKLWSTESASEVLGDLLPEVDVLFSAERDAEKVFGLDGSAAEKANHLATEYGVETVVITRGADGALALREGDVHERDAFETETVDAIGSGDAFVGGYLARRLDGGSIDAALEYGTATAALKRTIPGDLAVVTPEEVERIVRTGSAAGGR